MAASAGRVSSTAGLSTTELDIPGPAPERWNIVTRIAFRFAFSYWVLYAAPGVTFVWRLLAPWIAIHVFHLSGPVTRYQVTGSGDTTLDYIQNLIVAVMAVVGAAIWSVIDRKRANYAKLHPWLILFVRYTLAFILLSYGFAKVFPLQFPYPNFARMLERFGEFSPMGVLWNFMGASPAYTIFAGSMEVLGGLLLLFRRTATLGGLISAGVLLNVVLLNFCYDVPVKLFSMNLFLMAATVAAPDARRLVNLFLLHRSCEALSVAGPVFEQRWMRRAGAGLKTAVIVAAVGGHVYSGYQQYRDTVLRSARPPLYGIYDVERFTRDGKEVPPLATDSGRWRTLIASYPTSIQVKMIDDSVSLFGAKYDAGDTVSLKGSTTGTFTFSRPDSDHLVLAGRLGAEALVVKLVRVDPDTRFLLMSRGFHWIAEFPFNR